MGQRSRRRHDADVEIRRERSDVGGRDEGKEGKGRRKTSDRVNVK